MIFTINTYFQLLTDLLLLLQLSTGLSKHSVFVYLCMCFLAYLPSCTVICWTSCPVVRWRVSSWSFLCPHTFTCCPLLTSPWTCSSFRTTAKCSALSSRSYVCLQANCIMYNCIISYGAEFANWTEKTTSILHGQNYIKFLLLFTG